MWKSVRHASSCASFARTSGQSARGTSLDQDEPVGAEDELALLEQATLDLLELRQELDDLAGHAPDGAQRAQLGRQVGVQVADVEDLVLQVELELTLQEAA